MSIKRKALSVLSKAELLELGNEFGLAVKQAMRVDDLIDIIAGSKRARIEKLLPMFSREKLRDVCELLGLPLSAANKSELIDRILGPDRAADAPDDGEQLSLLSAPTPAPMIEIPAAPPLAASAPSPVPAPVAPAVEAPRPPPEPVRVAPLPAALPDDVPIAPPDTAPDVLSATPTLSRPVPPRQPRLLWHGWDRKELTSAVPTQVVEIVRPARAQERAGELGGMSARVRRDSEKKIRRPVAPGAALHSEYVA